MKLPLAAAIAITIGVLAIACNGTAPTSPTPATEPPPPTPSGPASSPTAGPEIVNSAEGGADRQETISQEDQSLSGNSDRRETEDEHESQTETTTTLADAPATASPTPREVIPEPTVAPTPSPTPSLQPEATSAPVPEFIHDLWQRLTIAPEHRCTPYDPEDYYYSPSVEANIVAAMGGVIYGPYENRIFESTGETDIEHIVARSEAHDSGLCAADEETRRAFAEDPLNLTLASSAVNRHQKSDNDAAEWLPDYNRCWFADRVVQVRLKYNLTVDQAEAVALESVLSECPSVELAMDDAPTAPQATATAPASAPTTTPTPNPPAAEVDALAMWDSNGNGQITCAEAREHGIAPVRRGHPAYEFMNDRDGDGIVCE